MADLNPAPMYRFQMAPWRFTVIRDGGARFQLGDFFPGLGEQAAAKIRAQYGLEGDILPLSINILLAENDRNKVLIDTGLGRDIGNGEGRLLEIIGRLGLTPEDIDTVFITHGHWDHIGMLADESGDLCFPNARHFMPAGEWDFWTSEENLERVGDPIASWARENLPPLAGKVICLEPVGEVLPGLRLLPAAGHTPAQAAVLFEGEQGQLLHVADAFHHPFQMAYPEYSSGADLLPDKSPKTRLGLLERAADPAVRVLGYHFPFPGLGTVRLENGAFRWVAAD